MSEIDLRSKRIVVTGASMGIGLACAEACVQAGAQVVICARNPGPLAQALERLNLHGRALSHVTDVTDLTQVDALLDFAAAQFGGIDGVIHCAAVAGPIGRVTELAPMAWLDCLRINLFGTFLVARQACQRMSAAGGGRIVLFSGGGATTPRPNFTAYACAKAGVVRFTETLALEMAPFHIAVNCIAPGFVATRLHEETLAAGERAGQDCLEQTRRELASGGVSPALSASTAAFLLSERSAGITGKLVASVHDDWEAWPEHLQEMADHDDLFTLRRIVPADRGLDWQ